MHGKVKSGMFEQLSERFQGAFRSLTGRGRLSEANIEEALREVRRALLEADVNFKVTRDFLARVQERALGEDVLKAVSPGQQIVKIVHDELVTLLGGEASSGLEWAPVPPTVIMVVGYQGSGKTTTVAKLAKRLARQGKKPLLAACDLYRPAAVEQLKTLGASIDVPVHAGVEGDAPPAIPRWRPRREEPARSAAAGRPGRPRRFSSNPVPSIHVPGGTFLIPSKSVCEPGVVRNER